MKRVAMLALFCCMIFFFFSSAAPGQQVTGPQMVMTETSHDFKEVGEGAVLEHSFQVINRGSQVLEIKNVNPG
jgi:hypothetical protein